MICFPRASITLILSDQVQMILVEIHDFRSPLAECRNEEKARFGNFSEMNFASPLAVVKLGRANHREEARRINTVHQLLGSEMKIGASG